jgi:hypothetical protein
MYFYRINKLIKEVKISARNYKKQGESYYQRPFGLYANNRKTEKEHQEVYQLFSRPAIVYVGFLFYLPPGQATARIRKIMATYQAVIQQHHDMESRRHCVINVC